MQSRARKLEGAEFGLGSAHWRSHIGVDRAPAHLPSCGVPHSTSASALVPPTIAHFTDVEPETSGVKPLVQDYAAGSGSGPIFSDRKISCLLT